MKSDLLFLCARAYLKIKYIFIRARFMFRKDRGCSCVPEPRRGCTEMEYRYELRQYLYDMVLRDKRMSESMEDYELMTVQFMRVRKEALRCNSLDKINSMAHLLRHVNTSIAPVDNKFVDDAIKGLSVWIVPADSKTNSQDRNQDIVAWISSALPIIGIVVAIVAFTCLFIVLLKK